MYIRSYKEEDAPILRDLFWNTVHTVNAVIDPGYNWMRGHL